MVICSQIVFLLPAGPAFIQCDKFGGRKMMSLGALTSCVLNWITSFGQSFLGILVPWGLNGYAQSLGWAPGSRVLSNWWPRHQRGMAFGLYMFGAASSAVLTFGLCILVLKYLDWRWVLRLPVLLLLAGGLAYFLVARNKPEDLGYPPLPDDAPKGDRWLQGTADQRSRATVTAETAPAPPASRASAHPPSVAPVVRMSSTPVEPLSRVTAARTASRTNW